MLLANPHFPWEGELRFWESQLTVPGNLNVYGASLGGLPGVQIGFTDKVAWTHTISDRHPLHALLGRPRAAPPTSYLVDGQPQAMTSKTFTIQVKQPNGTLQNQYSDPLLHPLRPGARPVGGLRQLQVSGTLLRSGLLPCRSVSIIEVPGFIAGSPVSPTLGLGPWRLG